MFLDQTCERNQLTPNRFDTNPTSIPITDTAVRPGFSTHSAEYTYFFRLPPDYDMLNFNPSVVNVSSHLELSHGIADKLIAFISTGDPNSYEGRLAPTIFLSCVSIDKL
jgi:hypothetical protein